MPPQDSPLASLFILAGIIIVLCSRHKLKTLGKMLLAIVVWFCGALLLALVLRPANPRLFGVLNADLALGVADVIGFFHVLRLRRADKTDGIPIP
jgi:hypothetical protein